MISKPKIVWPAFFACLAVVAGGMLWLSFKMVRLEALREADRAATETARQEAELQERVSASLYRMDLTLIPLVAQEASRPYQHYRPPASENPFVGTASFLPPVGQTPDWVLLYFEIDASGGFVSPVLLGEGEGEDGKLPGGGLAMQSLREAKKLVSFKTLSQRVNPIEKSALAFPDLGNRVAVQGNSYEVPAIDNAIKSFNSKQNEEAAELAGGGQKQSKLQTQQLRAADRINQDFNRRRDSTRNIAQQQAFSNMAGVQQSELPLSPGNIDVVYGVMQPIWLGENLMLVRPLEEFGETKFQCCWLDWKKIQSSLKQEVAELLPAEQIELLPIQADDQLDVGMALTTLPVQLEIDGESLRKRFSLGGDQKLGGQLGAWGVLAVSWVGFLLSAIVAAVLLAGVMGLSERRANFVSAVTHELRTPLTTFRMYSDMLASDMVPDEKKKQYVGTLRKQADRLSHLVDNVLQFARLENNPARPATEEVLVGAMLDRFVDRLESRADEVGLKFVLELDDSVAKKQLRTQPAMIEQVLFNLVDNACKYGRPSSTGEVKLAVGEMGGDVKFSVADGGPGIDSKIRSKMFEPFHKSDLEAANSEPGVGLGLALCKRMASSLGGELKCEVNADGGATFGLLLRSV